MNNLEVFHRPHPDCDQELPDVEIQNQLFILGFLVLVIQGMLSDYKSCY